MAWNEPGKNRNPWGNRPERGAADLDEALRRLQRRLAGIFGGGRGGNGDGSGSSSGGRARGFGIGTIAAALLVIWERPASTRSMRRNAPLSRGSAGTSARRSPASECIFPGRSSRGASSTSGRLRRSTIQTRMLTQDENLVDLNIAVQYRRARRIDLSFNVRDPEDTLGEVSE